MNILVTGGAGFIGTNLIKRFLKDKHSVTSIDNYSTGLSKNEQLGCEYLNEDIRYFYFDLYKFDVIYHLAALARIQPSFKNPKEYFETNANGTLNIADYCVRTNTPLIYAGSSSHHNGRFSNPYTFSKDIGEDVVRLYESHFGLKATIARFYNVYGPHSIEKGKYSTLIGEWEQNLKDNQPFVIYGDGSKRRDFTHVDDIVDALVKIYEKQAWGSTCEIGRGKSYSIKEIADMFGPVEIVYENDKPGEAQETLCDDMKTRKILSWKPKINIKDYTQNFKKNLK